MLDAALRLRMEADRGEPIAAAEAMEMLETSPLVKRLTAEPARSPLPAVWRLLALCEIPHAGKLPYVAALIDYAEEQMATDAGFSVYGTISELMPCYNAMLLEAYVRLGRHRTPSAQAALDWIKRYQPFARGEPPRWDQPGTRKHGGCLRAVPCYIGVAKAARALAHYSQAVCGSDRQASALLNQAMAYLLRHRLYRRLSDGAPINGHILDLAFPASYQLNIVELLGLADLTGRLKVPECADALAYVQSRMQADGTFHITHAYRADGYMSFDRRGSKGEWITYLLTRYLKRAGMTTDPPPPFDNTGPNKRT